MAHSLLSATLDTTVSVISFESSPLEKMVSGRTVGRTGELLKLCFSILS